MPRIRAPLISSMLRAAEYDDETQEMDITFSNGATYTYVNVPQTVFEGLRDAHSAGQYFNQNIKGSYGA